MWLENTHNAVFFLSTDIFFEYYAENYRITGYKYRGAMRIKANTDQFIQVSDRCLTVDGVVHDDEANKAIVLNCGNARLAIGFSGLSKYGSFNTRKWLLQTLNECAPPEYTAKEIVERFTEKTSRHFSENWQLKSIPPEHKRLSVMFTGYLYHHNPPLGALAVVSNFQNLDEGINSSSAYDEFKCFFREERRPNDGNIVMFFNIGTLPPIPKKIHLY